jgi:O-antigen/teichoic acid export membrane protein
VSILAGTSASPPTRRSARGRAVDTTALLVGTAVNGALAYVFFALATRTLGGEGAAPIAQLWTYWSASAAVLTFPVQHWIIRSSHTGAGLAAVRRVLPRVTGAVLALAGVVAVISWLAREQVFTSDDVAFPIMAAALTVGAFVVGVVRGRLAGVQRFVATGVAIAAENVLRVLLAVIVVWRAGGAVGFGLALSAGGLAVLAWPSAFRFPGPAAGGERASPTALLGGIAAGSLIAQLVLTGGPVVLATIGGGAAEITALFAALALFRAPYLLALGLVTQVTGAFTDLIVGGRHDMVRRIRRLVVGGGVLAAGAAWLFGLTVGPVLIRLVFGADVSPAAPIVALVAAATTVGLANLVFTVLLVARGSSGQLTTNWVAAVGVAAAVILASPLPPLPLVAWAFLAAEVTAFVLMWLGEVRAHRAWATAATADRERSPTP